MASAFYPLNSSPPKLLNNYQGIYFGTCID